jgi:transcriptional regulator with XRE-family HTH domain
MMKARGISAANVAKETGVKAEIVKAIQTGKEANPAIDVVGKLARFFRTSLDDLVNDQMVPITLFAPKMKLEAARQAELAAAAEGAPTLEARLRGARYVSPTIRDIGLVAAEWAQNIATSATSGATSGATAGVVAYSVAGPSPLPGPE